MMRALVYLGVGKLEMQDIPLPDGKRTLRLFYTGICGTDVKTYLKGHPMFTPPTILGHECIGTLSQESETGNVEGERLFAVAPYVECGGCENCRKGLPELCKNKTYPSTGSFCEFLGIEDDYIPKGLFPVEFPPLPVWTLVEPLACIINGLSKLKKTSPSGNHGHPRKNLIIGGGPMGALFATWFRSESIPYEILEKNDWRKTYLSSRGYQLASEIKPNTYDAMIIAANVPEIAEIAVQNVDDGGEVLLFAGFPTSTRLALDPYAIHYREVTVSGSFGFGISHFKKALEAIKQNREIYENLISHVLPLEEYDKAFKLAVSGECMKVVFQVRDL